MRSDLDPDLLLIESMLAPPPLDDARRSLDYWRGRGKTLPLYRRAVRPEAASSVGPIVIHYWASLRPCLGTAIAPRRRAPFRQTLLERSATIRRRGRRAHQADRSGP